MSRTLLIDFHLNDRIKDIISTTGRNLLYVSSNYDEVAEFFTQFPHHHKAYIGSGENTLHHRSLIHHADTIIFGSGNICSLSQEMKREGLWKEFLARQENVLFAGRSAGAIYLGKLYPSTNSNLLLQLGLGVLDKTIVMVHMENTMTSFHRACYARPRIGGIGLSSHTGMYVHESAVEKIGSNKVLVYDRGDMHVL